MKKNRILMAALLCAALITAFSVISFASEDTAVIPTESEAHTEQPDTSSLASADGSELTQPDGTQGTEGTDNEDSTDLPSIDANVFEVLFEEVKSHAGEICSALALIASLVLAYFYKCGLMPIIQNALNAISGVLTGIEKGADESSKASAEAISALRSRLESAEGVLDRIGESMTVLIEDLKARTAEASDAADTKVILSAQVDMLYDIFMTSALPQYQKDAVGEKIAAMRGALNKNDDEQTN